MRQLQWRLLLCTFILPWCLQPQTRNTDSSDAASSVPPLVLGSRLPPEPVHLFSEDLPPLPSLSVQRFSESEIEELSKPPHDTRIGARRLISSAMSHGVWARDGHGRRAWRLRISCTGALGLRVHFENFAVGNGQVWVLAPGKGPREKEGPFTGLGPSGKGRFWSKVLSGETVEIHYLSAAEGISAPPFQVTEVFSVWKRIIPAKPALWLLSRRRSLRHSARCSPDLACHITIRVHGPLLHGCISE